jgi:hypothetical protein
MQCCVLFCLQFRQSFQLDVLRDGNPMSAEVHGNDLQDEENVGAAGNAEDGQ